MYEDKPPVTDREHVESLVHLYVDGAFGRRELFQRVARYAGGAAMATAALAEIGLAQSPAACPEDVRVPEDAEDIEWFNVEYPGRASPLFGLLARPRNMTEPLPAVMVIHENRGLNEHIRDVTRRVARAGFVALGIDLLSRQGGSANFRDPVAGQQAYSRTTQPERNEDMLSSIEYLKSEGFVVTHRLGAIGFCAGGGNIYHLIFETNDLTAAVPFYGTPPNPLPAMDRVNTRLLNIFSDTDRNQARRIPGLIQALVDANKPLGLHLYPGSAHGFHNDTGAVYNRAAACDAWAKTIDFLRAHLFARP